jgi:hypothetical protein
MRSVRLLHFLELARLDQFFSIGPDDKKEYLLLKLGLTSQITYGFLFGRMGEQAQCCEL